MAQDPLWKAVHAIADRLAPALRREFLKSVQSIQGRLTIDRIVSAVSVGVRRSGSVVSARQFERELRTAIQVLETVYRRAGNVSRAGISFTGRSAFARDIIRKHTATLISDVTKSTQRGIRKIVERGFSEGRTVQQIASDVKQLIGLTDKQASSLLSLRKDLAKAGLTQKEINSQISRLRARMLRVRAKTIAQTETLTVANLGQVASWHDATQRGALDDKLKKTWIVTDDDRLCPVCEPMDGKQTSIDGDFNVDGRRIPAPPAHPNCRCTVGLET